MSGGVRRVGSLIFLGRRFTYRFVDFNATVEEPWSRYIEEINTARNAFNTTDGK